MRIFITGASGFVGGAAARHLTGAHTVLAMSRSSQSDAKIKSLGAQPVRCDLETVTAAHLEGIDAVIHSAAFVEAWGPTEVWDRINVGGTKQMLQVAKTARVRRFVHIGTEAAIVYGQDILNADESVPLALNSPFPYCRTKALAEQAVRAANSQDFETIVLRPRFIWGPGDQTLLPIIRSMAEKGQWMWFNHGRAMTSTVYIDNLIVAIELALSHGRPGEAYFILDDGTRSLHDVITGMARAVGVALPDRSLPRMFGDFVGMSLEFIWRFLNLKSSPPLTRHAAMVMSRDCTLQGGKAKSELGYVPKFSFEEGLNRLKIASGTPSTLPMSAS